MVLSTADRKASVCPFLPCDLPCEVRFSLQRGLQLPAPVFRHSFGLLELPLQPMHQQLVLLRICSLEHYLLLPTVFHFFCPLQKCPLLAFEQDFHCISLGGKSRYVFPEFFQLPRQDRKQTWPRFPLANMSGDQLRTLHAGHHVPLYRCET